MQNRNAAMMLTGVTALLCGFPGLCLCLFGALSAAGLGEYSFYAGQLDARGQTPTLVGVALLCLGVFMALTPVAVGFFTLRRKPQVENLDEPVPPAI